MDLWSGALRMEMYSRYGKATAAVMHMPVLRQGVQEKHKPVRVQLDNDKIAEMVQRVLQKEEETASPSKAKVQVRPSPAFTAVSRQQRADISTPSYVEAPGPAHYSPKADLTHPRSGARYRMQPVTTSPREKLVTLGSCYSPDTFICRFASKAATGKPLNKRPVVHRTISLRDFQRNANSTPLLPSRSALILRPNLSFTKQTPRKYQINTTSEFTDTSLVSSRHITTADFGKMQGRRDMFISDQIDGVYDAQPEKFRVRTDICLLDFGKMTARSEKTTSKIPDSPAFPLLQQGYQVSHPHTRVPAVHMNKAPARQEDLFGNVTLR